MKTKESVRAVAGIHGIWNGGIDNGAAKGVLTAVAASQLLVGLRRVERARFRCAAGQGKTVLHSQVVLIIRPPTHYSPYRAFATWF